MFGVADPTVADSVRAYVKLLRAARAVIARVEPALEAEGLTPTQLGVLEAVLHKGPLTHRDLGRKILTSAGNCTDLVDKLAARGLVERVRVPSDKRKSLVALTGPGRALIERVFPAHARDIAAAMGGLTAGELETLSCLLRRLGRVAAEGPTAPS